MPSFPIGNLPSARVMDVSGLLRIPFGDADLLIGLEIPGLHPQVLRPFFHIGFPEDTTAADRVIKGPPYTSTGKVDVQMDLQADKKVALSLGFTDEIGNPVPTPDGTTATYTVDDPTIINLTDNGDGTAEAAATGALGNATVHVDATWTDGGGNAHSVSGDLLISVVAGAAERVEIVAGTPEEVTPDV